MTSQDAVKLRLFGLPLPIAALSVPVVLRNEQSVAAIDLVEISEDGKRSTVVDIVVGAREARRVRDRLLQTFAAVSVEDVTGEADEPWARRMRIPRRSARPEEDGQEE